MPALRSRTFLKCSLGKMGIGEVLGTANLFVAGLRSDGVEGPFDALEVRIRPEEAQNDLVDAWQRQRVPYRLVLDEGVWVGRIHCELPEM